MEKNARIYIAGHRGMVGAAIGRQLASKGLKNIIVRTRAELDLTNQSAVESFFEQEKPDYVFLAAAKVGGIMANNTYRAQFIYENLMIESNIIHQSYKHQVKRLLFLGSSCVYPKFCEQPIKEEYLLTGALEYTNEPYAIAKIAGIKLCENYQKQYGCDFFAVMPTNLYGFGDNYDLNNSHVLPALLRKMHEAKIKGEKVVEIWGDGSPRREFLNVDDLAEACVFLMGREHNEGLINIGTGEDMTIKALAEVIAKVVGFEGEFKFDATKPNGTPRKVLDVSKIRALGWLPKIKIEEGIAAVYKEKFLKQ